MKKIIFFLATILVVNSYAKFNEKRAFLHIEKILSWGPRETESFGLKIVRRYIISHFRKSLWKYKIYSFSAQTPLGKKRMKNIFIYSGKKNINKPFILIGAHYESKHFKNFRFVGADDSASSLGMMLEFGRILSKKNFNNYNLGFVFFDGEESFKRWSKDDSLYGSRYQALLWRKTGFINKIKALIVLDMVGGINPRFCQDENSDKKLNDLVWNFARKKNLGYLFKDCKTRIEDDHLPFAEQKVRVIDIIPSPFPDYWHTEEDTLDKISIKTLKKVGQMIYQFILYLDSKKNLNF